MAHKSVERLAGRHLHSSVPAILAHSDSPEPSLRSERPWNKLPAAHSTVKAGAGTTEGRSSAPFAHAPGQNDPHRLLWEQPTRAEHRARAVDSGAPDQVRFWTQRRWRALIWRYWLIMGAVSSSGKRSRVMIPRSLSEARARSRQLSNAAAAAPWYKPSP